MLTEKPSNNKITCRTTEDSDLLVMKFWVILLGKESRLIKVFFEDEDNMEWCERRKL